MIMGNKPAYSLGPHSACPRARLAGGCAPFDPQRQRHPLSSAETDRFGRRSVSRPSPDRWAAVIRSRHDSPFRRRRIRAVGRAPRHRRASGWIRRSRAGRQPAPRLEAVLKRANDTGGRCALRRFGDAHRPSRLSAWRGNVFRPRGPIRPWRTGRSGRDASDPPVRGSGTGSRPGVLAHPPPPRPRGR